MNNQLLDEEKLREATCYGDIFAMSDLVQKGVNVNSANALNGWTALHWACQRGHSSAVELLLQAGADPSLANHRNQTPAQLTALPHIRAKLVWVWEAESPMTPNNELVMTAGIGCKVGLTPEQAKMLDFVAVLNPCSSDPALTPSSPTNSPSHESYRSNPEFTSPVTNGNNNNLNNNNASNDRSTTATPLSLLENCTTASSNDSIYGMSSKNSCNTRSLSSQSSVTSTRSSKSNRSSRLGAESSSTSHGHDKGMAGPGHNAMAGLGHDNAMAGLGQNDAMLSGLGQNNGRPGHANGCTASGTENGFPHPISENGSTRSSRGGAQGNGVAFTDPRRLSSSSCSSHSPPLLPSFRSSPPPLLSSPPSSPSPPPLLPFLHSKCSNNTPFSAGISTAAACCSPPPLPKSPTETGLELELDSPDAGERTPVNEISPASSRYTSEEYIREAGFQLTNNISSKLEALEGTNAQNSLVNICNSPESFLREQWHADFNGSLNCNPANNSMSGGVYGKGINEPSPALQVSQDYVYDTSNTGTENDNDDTFGQFIRDGQASFFLSDHVEDTVKVSSQESLSQGSENVIDDSAPVSLESDSCKEYSSKEVNYCPSSNKGQIFSVQAEDQDPTSSFANIFCSSTVNYDISLEEDPKDSLQIDCTDSLSSDKNLFNDGKKTSVGTDASISTPSLAENSESQNECKEGYFLDSVIENIKTKHPTTAQGEKDSYSCEVDCKNEVGKSMESPQECKESSDITTNLIRFTSNLSLHNIADDAAAFSEKAGVNQPISSLLDDTANILSPVDEILSLDLDAAVGNCVSKHLNDQSLSLGIENPHLEVKNSGGEEVIFLQKSERHSIDEKNAGTVKQSGLDDGNGRLNHNTAAAMSHASGKDAENQRYSKGLQTEPEAFDSRHSVEKRSVSTDPADFAFEMHKRCCCCCCSYPRGHRTTEGAAGSVGGSQEKTTVSRAVETDAVVPQVKEPEEIIIKIRVGGSEDPDFIEVPLPASTPTAAHRSYGALLQLCCTHLYLNPHHVQRIRKLPNIRLRNDADVVRLTSGAELELVVGGRGGVTGRGGGSGSATFPARPILY